MTMDVGTTKDSDTKRVVVQKLFILLWPCMCIEFSFESGKCKHVFSLD